MPYDPEKHHRRSIRLKGCDYSQAGAYGVTICVRGREALFGEITGHAMHLNACGRLAQETWEALPQRFSGVSLDAFVVMPNQAHGFIVRDGPRRGDPA